MGAEAARGYIMIEHSPFFKSSATVLFKARRAKGARFRYEGDTYTVISYDYQEKTYLVKNVRTGETRRLDAKDVE